MHRSEGKLIWHLNSYKLMLKKSTALNIGFNKLQYLVGTYYVQGTRSKMSQKMPAPERVLLQIRAQGYIITLQKRFHGQFKGGRQDEGFCRGSSEERIRMGSLVSWTQEVGLDPVLRQDSKDATKKAADLQAAWTTAGWGGGVPHWTQGWPGHIWSNGTSCGATF